jgi:protein SCO1/2
MRRFVLVALVVVAVAAVAIRSVAASPSSPRAASVKDRLAGTVVWPAGARPAPSFALRDQSGRQVTTRSLRGRVWAITFLDSNCTKACPIAARDLATVQRSIGAHHPLSVIIVSVLPNYDTPARVRAFAHKAGLSGDWHWLLGTRRQLAPVWRAYGIFVVTGLEHTAALYLVDKNGDVRVADAIPFVPAQLAGSARLLDTFAYRRRY